MKTINNGISGSVQEVVKILLKTEGLDVNAKDENGLMTYGQTRESDLFFLVREKQVDSSSLNEENRYM